VATLAPPRTDLRDKALKSLSLLPPFSPIMNRLVTTLGSEDVSFVEIADLIEKDTVLAGNVLRTVNSALYGMKGTINSVRHAVSLMGLAKIRNTAMSLSVSRMWSGTNPAKGWSAKTFNRNAVACAIMADLIAAESEVEYPEGAFTAGLLKSVGMLLIAIALPNEHLKIRQIYTTESKSLSESELEVLGFDHASLSGEVLRLWNLPFQIQAAVSTRTESPSEDSVLLGDLLSKASIVVDYTGNLVQDWIRPPATEDQTSQTQLARFGYPAKVQTDFQSEFDSLSKFFV